MVASKQEPAQTAAPAVATDAPPAQRPAVGEATEMMAYAPGGPSEPSAGATVIPRENGGAEETAGKNIAVEKNADAEPVASAHTKGFQAAPIPPVRPASFGHG